MSLPTTVPPGVIQPKSKDKKTPRKAALTVLKSFYHHPAGANTTGHGTIRSIRDVETDEQVYSRYVQATNEWSPIDLGWNPNPSLISIQYPVTGIAKHVSDLKRLGSIPHLEIGIQVGDIVIPLCRILVKDSFDCYPLFPESLRIRSSGVPIRYTVVSFPK